jgi:hypothetical protein
MNDFSSDEEDERKQSEDEEDEDEADEESWPVLFGFNALYVPAMSKVERAAEERRRMIQEIEAKRRKDVIIAARIKREKMKKLKALTPKQRERHEAAQAWLVDFNKPKGNGVHLMTKQDRLTLFDKLDQKRRHRQEKIFTDRRKKPPPPKAKEVDPDEIEDEKEREKAHFERRCAWFEKQRKQKCINPRLLGKTIVSAANIDLWMKVEANNKAGFFRPGIGYVIGYKIRSKFSTLGGPDYSEKAHRTMQSRASLVRGEPPQQDMCARVQWEDPVPGLPSTQNLYIGLFNIFQLVKAEKETSTAYRHGFIDREPAQLLPEPLEATDDITDRFPAR